MADLFGVQLRFESLATATNSVSQKDDLRPTERICP